MQGNLGVFVRGKDVSQGKPSLAATMLKLEGCVPVFRPIQTGKVQRQGLGLVGWRWSCTRSLIQTRKATVGTMFEEGQQRLEWPEDLWRVRMPNRARQVIC